MSASRAMEKHYQTCYGGERPGNDGGTNKWTGERDGKPDVIGALGGHADIECKLRASIPAFVKKALTIAHENCADNEWPIVVLFQREREWDTLFQFVLMRRSVFDFAFEHRIIDGSLAVQANRIMRPPRPTWINIFYDDGTIEAIRQPMDKESYDAMIPWSDIPLVADAGLYINSIVRNVPKYLLEWRDQVTKHTDKNGRLPVIAFHQKHTEYNRDIIIIPRVEFDYFFSPSALIDRHLYQVNAYMEPVEKVAKVKITYDDGTEVTINPFAVLESSVKMKPR